MAAAVKVAFRGEKHRWGLSHEGFAGLMANVVDIYKLQPHIDPCDTLVLKYTDVDGDEITVSSDPELAAAIKHSCGKALSLTLEVHQADSKAPPAATPAAPVRGEVKPDKENRLLWGLVDLIQPHAMPELGLGEYHPAAIVQIASALQLGPRKLCKSGLLDRSNVKKWKHLQKLWQGDGPRHGSSAQRRQVSRGLLTQFVSHLGLPENSRLECGQRFTTGWRLRNASKEPWPANVKLGPTSDLDLGLAAPVPIPGAGGLEPGQCVDVLAEFVAPMSEGDFCAFFRLEDALSGSRFGERLWLHASTSRR